MKIVEIISLILGLIVFGSFFSVFIAGFVFGRLDIALIFVTAFFLSLPVSFYFVRIFEKRKKMSVAFHLAMIAFFVFGIVCIYFVFDTFKTKTVLELSLLEESEGTFVGYFSIPKDVSPVNNCTFFLELKYGVHRRGEGEIYSLVLENPSTNYSSGFEIYEDKTMKKWEKFDYEFEPLDGEYKIIINKTHDSRSISLRSIKLILREYK